MSQNDEMIDKMRTLVQNDKRVTVRELSEVCRISVGSCDAILTKDLDIVQRVASKFKSLELFERPYKNKDFIKNSIT